MNVTFNNRLFEITLDQFSTSGITNKAIQKDGTGNCRFIKAILNYPQSLHILYEVQSSHDDNKHFSVNGQLMAGLQKGYAVQLHFENISNIIPPNFSSLQYSQQVQILQDVFDKADVKIQCDCGSFYWQGMFERDDKDNNVVSPFTGTPGTGEWQARHNASGNKSGKQMCKHVWCVSEHLDKDINVILKSLGSSQSQAASTIQPVDEAEPQEQPAGLPNESKQGVDKTTTINAEKAEPTVKTDIEEIKANSEMQDSPEMDTSNTEAKEANPESDNTAEKGPQEAEPPLEEPTKATDNPQGNNAINKKTVTDNDEELDTTTKTALNERIKNPVLQFLREMYKNPNIDWIEKFINNLKDDFLNKNENNIKDNISALKLEKGIQFVIDPSSQKEGKDSILSAYFDQTYIKIKVSPFFFQNIKDNRYIDEIIEKLEYIYLHEEIHLQQKEKSNGLAIKNIPNDLTNKLDIDAYARETAYLLQKQYTSDIIKRKISSFNGIIELDNYLKEKEQASISFLGLYYYGSRTNNQKQEWKRFINKLIQFIENKYEKVDDHLYEKVYNAYHSSKFENNDLNPEKRKNKRFIEALREELFYRGYRNNSLFQSGELLPNDNSKVLFLATDADHAYQFAIGQTTAGDKMIFEIYDIPVENLKIYNLQKDDENVREASIKQGGTGIQYYDQDYMVELLKSKGYNGWTKLDHTMQEDEDDMPGYGRVTSRTWELGLFDKDKYKPVDRIVSDDNQEFSDEQIEYLLDKYKVPFFQKLIDQREYTEQYEDMYENTPEMEEMDAYYKRLESEEKEREERLNKERNIQDSGQLNLFGDNTPSERQTLRKRIIHIAKTFDGYEKDGYDFKEIWEDLSEQGYSDDELRIANRYIIGEITPDISGGWSSTEWNKFDKELTNFLNKKEDEQLKESKLSEILISTEDIDPISDRTPMIDKLTKIEMIEDWENIGAEGNGAKAILRLKQWADKSWIISDSNDEPLGIVGIQIRYLKTEPKLKPLLKNVGLRFLDKEYVDEILLLAFKRNTITLVKDVLKLLQDLKKEYYFVKWSVEDNIPAKDIYDRYLPKLNGKVLGKKRIGDMNKTLYIISKSFDKIKEGLADDNFQQIYDDLTDAAGYLAGPSDETENSKLYMELGDAVSSIKNVFEEIYEKSNKLKESEDLKHYSGNCVNNSLFEDATEMAQDFGYYATFDDFEDPADSNYEEIDETYFEQNCDIDPKFWKKGHVYLFLKRYDDSIFCAYDENEDIHYFWS